MPSPQDVRKTLKDVVGVVKAAIDKVNKYLGTIPEREEKAALVEALESLTWAITALEKTISLPSSISDIKLEHIQGLLDNANVTIAGAKLLSTDNFAKIGLNGAQTTIALQAMRVARVATPQKEG